MSIQTLYEGVGGMGGGKNFQLRHGWNSYDNTHTMAYATLVGYRDVQSVVETILGPY